MSSAEIGQPAAGQAASAAGQQTADAPAAGAPAAGGLEPGRPLAGEPAGPDPGGPAAAPVSWRFLISRRWLGWHATMVAAVAGMLALGWWQYSRAMAGNALSWAYTFEWPMFAIFGVVFWAKTIRDEFQPPDIDVAADRAEHAVGLAADDSDPTGRELMPYEPEDEDLNAYNAYLARLNDQAKDHGRWHGLR